MERSRQSALLEPVFFPLVEEICLCAAQVHDFRAAISILLLHCALLAVEGVGDAHSSADHAAPLI